MGQPQNGTAAAAAAAAAAALPVILQCCAHAHLFESRWADFRLPVCPLCKNCVVGWETSAANAPAAEVAAGMAPAASTAARLDAAQVRAAPPPGLPARWAEEQMAPPPSGAFAVGSESEAPCRGLATDTERSSATESGGGDASGDGDGDGDGGGDGEESKKRSSGPASWQVWRGTERVAPVASSSSSGGGGGGDRASWTSEVSGVGHSSTPAVGSQEACGRGAAEASGASVTGSVANVTERRHERRVPPFGISMPWDTV